MCGISMAVSFPDILVSEGLLSDEQLAEAISLSKNSGKKVQDEVIRLGYAPSDQVIQRWPKVMVLNSSI